MLCVSTGLSCQALLRWDLISNYGVCSVNLLGLLSSSSFLCLTGGVAEGTRGLSMSLRVSEMLSDTFHANSNENPNVVIISKIPETQLVSNVSERY